MTEFTAVITKQNPINGEWYSKAYPLFYIVAKENNEEYHSETLLYFPFDRNPKISPIQLLEVLNDYESHESSPYDCQPYYHSFVAKVYPNGITFRIQSGLGV